MGNDEKPLTLSDLERFYREVMRPETQQLVSNELVQYHQDVLRPEIQQSIFSQLIRFYRNVVRPEGEQIMDEKLEAGLGPLRDEMHQGFDDLCKKYEEIRQEMTVTNLHIDRLNTAVFGKKTPEIH